MQHEMTSGGGNRGKRKPRGKPFRPGHEVGERYRWQPGQSGNPNGRPRDGDFRQRCREVAAEMLEAMASGNVDPGLAGAFEAIADRGGFVPVDKLVQLERVRAQALVDVLSKLDLPPEERQRAIAAFRDEPLKELLAIDVEDREPKP